MGYDSGMDDVLARLHVTEEQIAAYCRKWAIVRFELFGSALRADFDEKSDGRAGDVRARGEGGDR